MPIKILNNEKVKTLSSPGYHSIFNKVTGEFIRWGKTLEDDPEYCEFGPEIADIEISTICSGVNGKVCDFCYKRNQPKGKNMSLETFKKIFHKLPEPLTQIAFGIGNIWSNPDMFDIFRHTREHGIVPNVTINGYGVSDDDYSKLTELCGAVAVSCYDPKEVCYQAVYNLTRKGLEQVNIHKLLCGETLSECFQVIDDAKSDSRLEELNAIVFLALKQCGRGTKYTPISLNNYTKLVQYAFRKNVDIGFDSCSAPMFMNTLDQLTSIVNSERLERMRMAVEPCESTLFSTYIDVEGRFYPCSFCEQRFTGLDVVNCDDFLKDIWFHSAVNAWREKLIQTKHHGLIRGVRQCPEYKVWQ